MSNRSNGKMHLACTQKTSASDCKAKMKVAFTLRLRARLLVSRAKGSGGESKLCRDNCRRQADEGSGGGWLTRGSFPTSSWLSIEGWLNCDWPDGVAVGGLRARDTDGMSSGSITVVKSLLHAARKGDRGTHTRSVGYQHTSSMIGPLMLTAGQYLHIGSNRL